MSDTLGQGAVAMIDRRPPDGYATKWILLLFLLMTVVARLVSGGF
jgi:hypothetical protein